MNWTIDEAREFLKSANVFLGDDNDAPKWGQTINLNDTWAWAACDGVYVLDEDLPEVASLFWRYGFCGILYWASERDDGRRSEFHDINRFIEFVRHEEAIRQDEPHSSKRAYLKHSYMIGNSPCHH